MSLSSTRTWLYPDFKSSLVKYLAPLMESKRSSIEGKQAWVFTVSLFNWRQSHTILKVPSLFRTKNTGAPYGDLLGRIKPLWSISFNRPLYLLLSGFARGQALGCHAVARADRMQKSMQKHCRDHGKRQSVVLNRRLPASTFSPNHWSWRCHLLAPHWAEIDRLASGAERAREIKETKQLAIADAGAAAAAAQSEGETSSRRACGSRKADRGTQETWGRNGASTCLLECESASSLAKGALSHTLFWERERKRRSAEAFISGLTLSVVQWEALWKALGIEMKEKILSHFAANEDRDRKNVRGAGRLAEVTLEDQLLVMIRLRIRLGWLQQELAYIFGVSEACVSLTFQEVDYFLVLEAGTTSAVAILGGCEGIHGRVLLCEQPWHIFCLGCHKSCAPKFVAVWPCSHSFILLTRAAQCWRTCLVFPRMAQSTLSVSCGMGPSAITSWWSRASCFVLQKIFIITFTSSVTFQLYFFYFLTSFICCVLIRMIPSQASCFVFHKKKF